MAAIAPAFRLVLALSLGPSVPFQLFWQAALELAGKAKPAEGK